MKTNFNFRASRQIVIILLALFCLEMAGCTERNTSLDTNTNKVSAPNTNSGNVSAADSSFSEQTPDAQKNQDFNDAAVTATNIMDSHFPNGNLELTKMQPKQKEGLVDPRNNLNRTKDANEAYRKLKNNLPLNPSELSVVDFFFSNREFLIQKEKPISRDDRIKYLLALSEKGNSFKPEASRINPQATVSPQTPDLRGTVQAVSAEVIRKELFWRDVPLVIASLTSLGLLALLILSYVGVSLPNFRRQETSKQPRKQDFEQETNNNQTNTDSYKSFQSELQQTLDSYKLEFADAVADKLVPEIKKIKTDSNVPPAFFTDQKQNEERRTIPQTREFSINPQPVIDEQAVTKRPISETNAIKFPKYVEEIEQLNAQRFDYDPITDSFVEANEGSFYLISDNHGQNCIVPAVKLFKKRTDFLPFNRFYYQSPQSDESGKVRIEQPAIVENVNGNLRFTSNKGILTAGI